jgi:hypothetical protein
MLGFSATVKSANTAAPSFVPSLPPTWADVWIRNLRFRNSTMNVEIAQDGGRAESHSGPRVKIIAPKATVATVPIQPPSERGEINTSLKILGVTTDDKARTLTVELAGLAGRTYDLDLVTTEPRVTSDGAQIEKTTSGYRLHIPFGAGEDYVTKTITVRY